MKTSSRRGRGGTIKLSGLNCLDARNMSGRAITSANLARRTCRRSTAHCLAAKSTSKLFFLDQFPHLLPLGEGAPVRGQNWVYLSFWRFSPSFIGFYCAENGILRAKLGPFGFRTGRLPAQLSFWAFAKISSKTWDLTHIWRTGRLHAPRLEARICYK